ncbi:MAG: hypothetical protein SFU21_11940 [Flavihumibacter sp.]|nr:hypothetical protein [Flavihumibacter sp.]
MIHFFKNIAGQLKKGNLSILLQFKYLLTWRQSVQPSVSSVSNRWPWLTFDAIDFLKKTIKKDNAVFEFGGGGSTLFFLDHAKEVVTVEHDGAWFSDLVKIIGNNHYWKGTFIEPEATERHGNPAIVNDYASDDTGFKKFSFKKYATAIDSYNDNYFDIVLVDGRARTSCIAHAINKIKQGGLLIVDNAERQYYFAENKLAIETHFNLIQNHWGAVPFSSSFSKTAIWQRK